MTIARRVAALEKATRHLHPETRHDMSALSTRALELVESAADWCTANPKAEPGAQLAYLDGLFASAGMGLRHTRRGECLVWEDYPSAVAPPQIGVTPEFPHCQPHSEAG